MQVRVVANAHAMGGGEMSTMHIMRLLLKADHDVVFHPIKGIHRKLHAPPVEVSSDFFDTSPTTSDLLLIYANDLTYTLTPHEDHWREFMDMAERVVVVLNFTMGQAQLDWFASRIHKAIFLNTDKAEEYQQKAKAFKGAVQILAPCVELEPFLGIKPPLMKPPRIVRHSRYGGKYKQDDHEWIMKQTWKHCPEATFSFMAAPPWMHQWAAKEKRIIAHRWDDMPVADFLASGNIFWYRLPGTLRDQGPRVIVEAMAAGLPCVADGRDGAKDRIVKTTGFLCDGNHQFVVSLKHLIDFPVERARMGMTGKERAKHYFQPEKWIPAILKDTAQTV